MAFPFFMFAFGVMLVYSGWKNGTLAQAFTGTLPPPGTPAPSSSSTGSGSSTENALLHGSKMPRGVSTFDGKPVAAWIVPYLKEARRRGWHGTVTSGFRSYADQVRIWNSGVRPAARPGTSNHEGSTFPRGAVDVSDAATLSRILTSMHAPLEWAGAKDPVHFSHPHGGGY